MNKQKTIVLLLVTAFTVVYSNAQQTDSIPKKSDDGQSNQSSDSLNFYMEKTGYSLNERDYKSALDNIDKAIGSIKDKSENNRTYLVLAIYHSRVYSLFQHMDEAESVLLKATGLSDNDVTTIVQIQYPPATKKLIALAKRINRCPDTKTKIGPHIALADIYYILKDSANRKAQENLSAKRPEIFDCVIKISGYLYMIGELKQNTYKGIQILKEKITKEGETKENQMELAKYYCLIGQFTSAGTIADKYLSKNNNDIDFLFIKYNIEMALGNLDKMKEDEKKILAINPKALDQNSTFPH